ncbi:MAG: hypothetical protein KC613_04185, partial [Myxococcales bacterium]|nr:hypothetical protein [Myxococcales bacterium]
GGAGGGGMVTPEDDSCEPGDTDTAAAPAANEWGPSAYVVALDIPDNADAAFAAGCNMFGASAGSALAPAEDFLGDAGNLDAVVTPDETGNADLTLMARLDGAMEGMTGNQIQTSDISFFVGSRDGEGNFLIDLDSFEGGDAANGPLISFENACVANGKLKAPGSRFSVTLPIVEGLPLSLTLEQTRFSGDLDFDAVGFNVSNGALRGYLTQGTLEETIAVLTEVCASETPPDLCGTIGQFLQGPPETVIDLLFGLLGVDGFDVNIAGDGTVADCADDNCNGIGVCLLVDMRSVAISGTEPMAD